MQTNKKVVALDLDFDAPGLHVKLGVNCVAHGYVNYLIDTIDKERQRSVEYYYTGLGDQVGIYAQPSIDGFASPYRESLRVKDYAYPLGSGKNGSYLIPAGNSIDLKYWGHLASEDFNKRFYLRPEQMDNQDIGRWLASCNIKWFENEVIKIESEFSPDYLLIDCKTANERAAVPLLLFADEVVSMFTLNPESLAGTAMVQRALLGSSKKVKVTSVICRVPASFEIEDAINTDTWKQIWADMAAPISDITVLHECRGLESDERLLLGGACGNGIYGNDLSLQLSHDYMHLFKLLAPEVEESLKKNEGAELSKWKALLGMKQEAEVIEQYFELLVSGPMLNRDNEANVALRVATLRSMLDSIYGDYIRASDNKALASEQAIDVFRRAGHSAGASFGMEMMDTKKVFPKGPPQTIGERLAVWSKFDSEVGFGHIHAALDARNPNTGQITVQNNFLTEGREKGEPDINSFFCGYLQGVLEKLLEQPEIRITYNNVNETFTFEIATP